MLILPHTELHERDVHLTVDGKGVEYAGEKVNTLVDCLWSLTCRLRCHGSSRPGKRATSTERNSVQRTRWTFSANAAAALTAFAATFQLENKNPASWDEAGQLYTCHLV